MGASVAGTTAAGAKLGTAALAFELCKWVGIGAVVGASAVGIRSYAAAPEHTRAEPSARAGVEATRAIGSSRAGRLAPAPVPPSVQEAESSAAPSQASFNGRATTRGLPSPLHDDVSREIGLLDAARRSLSAGDPQAALAHLDETALLTRRALVPEATVLRVRALLILGRTAEARALVDRFTQTAPASPQASVLRSLVDAPSKP